MTATLCPLPKFRAFDSNGAPLAGGLLYTYAAGTTTPLATYTDQGGSTPNANPVILDANGEANIWLGSASYKLKLDNAAGVTQWTVDNIQDAGASALADLASTSSTAKGDALIGVKKTATGASATTQHKVNETRAVDVVADYGADNTGVTDASVAINAAVTNNRDVYLPPGTYKLASAISMPSNTRLFGAGASSILKAATDGMYVITIGTTASRTGVTLENFAIDGGGQTSDIYTGVKAVTAIYGTQCSNVRVTNITAYKLGVANQSAPKADAGYAGCGIDFQSNSGSVWNVRITNCTVYYVAGGGEANGDAFNASAMNGNTLTDVIFEGCWASTVGRHCYALSGVDVVKSSGVKIINCYGTKSALDGVDLEDATDVLIDGCTFVSCGNDQTYFNPALLDGATYRLLAGIAVSQPSNNVTINNTRLYGCYYGIDDGGAVGLTISNCVVGDSTVSDLSRGLAGSATNFKIINTRFESALDALSYNLSTAGGGFVARDCVFTGTVKVTAMADGVFEGCTFKKGFAVIGGDSGFARNKFLGCVFTNWAGVGIQCDSANYAHPDNIVQGCSFYGTGNMTIGISFGNNSALRWQINGNTFEGMTTAGIQQALGNNIHTFDARGNSFKSMPIGISFNQAMNDTIIEGNNFTSITNYCIYTTSLSAMNYANISNNNVGAGCTNGFQISGTWDYCIIMGNNVHAASGTKWNVSGGQNTNGVTANNITT